MLGRYFVFHKYLSSKVESKANKKLKRKGMLVSIYKTTIYSNTHKASVSRTGSSFTKTTWGYEIIKLFPFL